MESDQNAVTVVDLMLDDLSSPAGKGFEPFLKGFVLIPHFDGTVPFCLPCTGERQTTLFSLVRAGELDDFGVEHDHGRSVVIENDNSLGYADHVCRHPHSPPGIRLEGVQQIRGNLLVQDSCIGGLLREEDWVFVNGFDHGFNSQLPSDLSDCYQLYVFHHDS